jgi:hypothetical protein
VPKRILETRQTAALHDAKVQEARGTPPRTRQGSTCRRNSGRDPSGGPEAAHTAGGGQQDPLRQDVDEEDVRKHRRRWRGSPDCRAERSRPGCPGAALRRRGQAAAPRRAPQPPDRPSANCRPASQIAPGDSPAGRQIDKQAGPSPMRSPRRAAAPPDRHRPQLSRARKRSSAAGGSRARKRSGSRRRTPSRWSKPDRRALRKHSGRN